jgi:hypothetical protein
MLARIEPRRPTEGAAPASDVEFARAFERGEIRNDAFHHRDHLRIAWVYVRECQAIDVAADRMCALLRAFANKAGRSEKYHETLTVFWVQILGQVEADRSFAGTELDDVLTAHPHLLDKDTPLTFYSRARLFSDEARASWIPPDLRCLSDHATGTDSRHPSCHAPHRLVPG